MVKTDDIIISHYSDKSSRNGTPISLVEELDRIKNGTFKTEVDLCRYFLSQGLISDYKSTKSFLSVVTFGGQFDGPHKAENLKIYSQLMVIDFDHLTSEELSQIKEQIFLDEHTMAVWASPSNQGLKVLFKTTSTIETHKIYFGEICDYTFKQFGIEADKSGSDVCRLCFTSYDPQLLYRFDSKPFCVDLDLVETKIINKPNKPRGPLKLNDSIVEKRLFFATEGKNQKRDRDSIDKIIKYLKSRNLSITQSYNEWYRVALAITNTFTYDLGKKYFLYLCRLDGLNHDEYKSLNILEYCYRNRKINEVNFATILHLAEQKGFRL